MRIGLSRPLMRSVASFRKAVLSRQSTVPKRPLSLSRLPAGICVPAWEEAPGLTLSALCGCGREAGVASAGPSAGGTQCHRWAGGASGRDLGLGPEGEAVHLWQAGCAAWKIGRGLQLGPAVWPRHFPVFYLVTVHATWEKLAHGIELNLRV